VDLFCNSFFGLLKEIKLFMEKKNKRNELDYEGWISDLAWMWM
jgi:hypothetical protein